MRLGWIKAGVPLCKLAQGRGRVDDVGIRAAV
jgi:hypothetical protein